MWKAECAKAQRLSAFAALRGRENGAPRSSVRLRTDWLWTSLRSRSLSYDEALLAPPSHASAGAAGLAGRPVPLRATAAASSCRVLRVCR